MRTICAINHLLYTAFSNLHTSRNRPHDKPRRFKEKKRTTAVQNRRTNFFLSRNIFFGRRMMTVSTNVLKSWLACGEERDSKQNGRAASRVATTWRAQATTTATNHCGSKWQASPSVRGHCRCHHQLATRSVSMAIAAATTNNVVVAWISRHCAEKWKWKWPVCNKTKTRKWDRQGWWMAKKVVVLLVQTIFSSERNFGVLEFFNSLFIFKKRRFPKLCRRNDRNHMTIWKFCSETISFRARWYKRYLFQKEVRILRSYILDACM